MRVLVLTPYVAWPLDHGGRLRTHHLLRALARDGHEVVNVAVARTPRHRDDAQELEKRLGVAVRPGLVPEPDMTTPARRAAKWVGIALGRSSLPGRWWNADFAVLVRQSAESASFDLVVIDSLWMDVYRPCAGGLRYLASSHNVESDVLRDAARHESGLRRRLAERDAALLARHEAAFFAGAASAIAVSHDDATRIRALAPGARVTVVENGVDTEAIVFRPRSDTRGPLLFVGSFDYPANVDAAKVLVNEVLPRVREKTPGASVVLAGRNPPPEVRALARDGVEVIGPVPDLAPVYERAGAVVVPLRFGGGTRIKILEALAYGRPVVTTAAGASGLAVRPEQHVLVADTADAMAAAVARLAEDPALVARLAKNGRSLVEDKHAWAALEDSFASAVRALGQTRRSE